MKWRRKKVKKIRKKYITGKKKGRWKGDMEEDIKVKMKERKEMLERWSEEENKLKKNMTGRKRTDQEIHKEIEVEKTKTKSNHNPKCYNPYSPSTLKDHHTKTPIPTKQQRISSA